MMRQDEKIYVDAGQPATLLSGGRAISCPTLQEAWFAWDRLPSPDRERATIRVDVPGGPLYMAAEIDRLHYGPQPKAAA